MVLRSRIHSEEIDILYTVSNKLTQASTPAESLEAVSDYARDHGATSGLLLYMEHDALGKPEYLVIAALWGRNGVRIGQIGDRYYLRDHADFVKAWMANPARPLLIGDVITSEIVSGETRKLFADQGRRGMALLPLNIKGRWVGQLTFNWSAPFYFDENDLRILTAVIQQAGPVIDSMRLYEKSLERAARAEHLLAINTALSRAVNEAEILAAVALYSDRQRPSSLTLGYLSVNDAGHPAENTIVAVWHAGDIRPDDARVGSTFHLADFETARLWVVARPDQVLLIEDSECDSRVDEHARAMMRRIGARAMAVIPLYSYGSWQGLVSVEWPEPHVFTAEETYIYTSLLQIVPPVVAGRRAYLAEEQARQERELLYSASQGINAAHTFQEIVDALVRLNMSGLSIVLWIWENYDFKSAGYMELVAKAQGNTWPLGTRLPVEQVPSVNSVDCNKLIVVENTADRSRMDAVTAATTESHGYHALLSVPLCLQDRFMGLLGFECSSPRIFTTREKRLAASIGELVTAAVERMRLKEETDRLNQQAQAMVALEERNRLARELHDSVSQALYGIVLGIRTAQTLLERDPAQVKEPLDYVFSLAEAGLAEMRGLIFELRPELLDHEGLAIALEKQAFSIQARHGLHVETELCEEPTLSIGAKEALYRIAREALHNVVKHAQASRVSVRLLCDVKGIVLEIADNGLGFDTGVSFPGHLGLQSMRERAFQVNGTLTLDSRPGEGTCLRVFVPHH